MALSGITPSRSEPRTPCFCGSADLSVIFATAPKRDGMIIRPLLEVSRREIESYLDERGLPFRTDASNLESDYTRNRIRNELLPVLREYNPNVDKLIPLTNVARNRPPSQNYAEFSGILQEELNGMVTGVTEPEAGLESMTSRVNRLGN